MNYRIILYYCVFHLISFGLDARIVNFDLKSIHGLRTVYGSGTLTYFSDSDQTGDTSFYVFYESALPTGKFIEEARQQIGKFVEQAELNLIDDILDTKDKTIENMYKIMRKDIENYVYDGKDDVSIVYKMKCFTLNFIDTKSAKNFIDTLPSSVKIMDKVYYETLKTLIENYPPLTTF